MHTRILIKVKFLKGISKQDSYTGASLFHLCARTKRKSNLITDRRKKKDLPAPVITAAFTDPMAETSNGTLGGWREVTERCPLNSPETAAEPCSQKGQPMKSVFQTSQPLTLLPPCSPLPTGTPGSVRLWEQFSVIYLFCEVLPNRGGVLLFFFSLPLTVLNCTQHLSLSNTAVTAEHF